jgi:Mrp family chromosome partitioning ATPase
MAKIYDALRRAEEERKRRAGDDLSPAAPLDVEPAAPARKARRPSIWRRMFTRRSRHREDPGGGAEVNKRRIAIIQPDSYVAEQFRAVRGRIDAMASERKITTIIIASAFPGEGKTTAAVNLAAVTALGLGRRVLLIDCDLRKPKVHTALGLRPQSGLAEVLRKETTLDGAITTYPCGAGPRIPPSSSGPRRCETSSTRFPSVTTA